MAHARGRTFRRGGISESQRRKKTWSGFTIGSSGFNGFTLEVPALVAPGSVLTLVSFSAAQTTSLAESTLMRLRGSVLVPKSTPDALSDQVTIAFGVAMVTDDAAALGAVPNPATILGSDWDGWLFYRANLAAPFDANATVMDAKAMRKFNGGMSLVFVGGQASDAASAESVSIGVILRGLFLLA